RQGLVTGLRIDHIDGLLDPLKYLWDLQRSCRSAMTGSRKSHPGDESVRLLAAPSESDRPFYIVVEQILVGDEQLRPEWPIYGSTGYDFTNLINGVFVDPENKAALVGAYERFVGQTRRFSDVVYEAKKLIVRVSMSSELNVLARRLDRISEQ